ncbi:Flp pilus assembly protein TadG [Brevibacterium pityocampae]
MRSAFSRLSAKRRSERGSLSIEFAGTFFMYLVLLLVALQAMLAMFALAQANSASRNAARSEVVTPGTGVSAGQAAVSQPLRNSGTDTVCSRSGGSSNGSVTCSVTIAVPMFNLDWISDWVPPFEVTRTNVQPITEVY